METIVYLTHSRPECLVLSLESLRRARGIEGYHLIFPLCEDCHPDIPIVIAKMAAGLDYTIQWRPAGWLCEHANGEAFNAGAADADTYFIEVAEDERISRDYLEMVEWIVRHDIQPDLLAIGGGYLQLTPDAGPEDLVASSRIVTLATAFMAKPFNQYIRPWLNDEYYAGEYLSEQGVHFYPPGFFEKYFPEFETYVRGIDGLIHRLTRRHKLYSIIPLQRRAQEIGFLGRHYYYNQKRYEELMTGKDTWERADVMRKVVADESLRELWGKLNTIYHQLPDDHVWNKLRIVPEPLVSFIRFNKGDFQGECYCPQPIPLGELAICEYGGLAHIPCEKYLGTPGSDCIVRWQ